MAKTKMDENGKVQIPLEAIKNLGLKSGDEFEFEQNDDVLVLKPILLGKSRSKSPPLSAFEKNEIEASEREFVLHTAQVYDNASVLIDELHAERKKAQADKRAK